MVGTRSTRGEPSPNSALGHTEKTSANSQTDHVPVRGTVSSSGPQFFLHCNDWTLWCLMFLSVQNFMILKCIFK